MSHLIQEQNKKSDFFILFVTISILSRIAREKRQLYKNKITEKSEHYTHFLWYSKGSAIFYIPQAPY